MFQEKKGFQCIKSTFNIYNLCIGLLLLAAYCYIVVTLLLLHYCWHLSDGNTLVICQHYVHSHPLTAFSSKKSDRLTRHQTKLPWNHNFLVRTGFFFIIIIVTMIQEIKSIDKPPSSPVYKKQLSYVCVSVCLPARDDGDFRSAGYSAKQNSANMLERATRFVDLCKWICGTRWEVDFWRARLQISLSAGFWQIIGCGFLGGAHIRHSNHRSVMVQRSDYMQRAGCRSHGQDDDQQRNDHLPPQPCDACVNHIGGNASLHFAANVILIVFKTLKLG